MGKEYNLSRKKNEKGKYGYVDKNENWVIEPKFMVADEFERGVARVQLDGMWGFLKEDGTWLIEPNLHYAHPFSNEIACVQYKFFKGYINRKGEWFIPPVLIDTWGFGNESVTEVTNMDQEVAYISNKGEMITGFEMDSRITYGHGFIHCNRIKARKDGKFGFLDEKGHWVVPPIYEWAADYVEDRTFVSLKKSSENYFLIDLDGKILKEGIYPQKSFNNGLAIVKVAVDTPDNSVYQNYKMGVIDKDGHWIISPLFDDLKGFEGGFSIFEDQGKFGVINEEGKVIIEAKYDKISKNQNFFSLEENNKFGLADLKGNIILTPQYSQECLELKENFIRVCKKDRYGLTNSSGKVIIKPCLDSISYETQVINGKKYFDVEKEKKSGWMGLDGDFLGNQLYDSIHGFSDGLAAVNKDGLWGFIDEEGKFVIEPQFDEVLDFKNGIAVVNISNHYGLIDKTGNWVSEPKFDQIKEFSEGMAPAKIFNPKARASKWGFIDNKGEFVINPEFDDLQIFIDNYAKAKSNGKWGLIDKYGKWFVEPQYDDIEEFKNGLAEISNDGLKGLINQDGKEVANPIYTTIHSFNENGIAEVEIKNKTGYINREGVEVVPVQVSDGFINNATGFAWAKVKGKYGYIDTNEGKWIIAPKYEDIQSWEDASIIRVKINGKWGMIDYRDNWLISPIFDSRHDISGKFDYGLLHFKNGYYNVIENKWALPPDYEKSEFIDKNLFCVSQNGKKAIVDGDGRLLTGKWYEDIILKNGNIWVKDNDKYGVMDKSGNWMVKPVFDQVGFPYYTFNGFGLTRVKIDDKWGFSDVKGNILGERMFDSVIDFKEGYAVVEENDLYGLMDRDGKVVVEPRYQNIEIFYNELARVKDSSDLYGFLNKEGEMVIAPKFAWVESFERRLSRATLDRRNYGVINMKGEWVIEPSFEEIGDIREILAVKKDGKYGYINLSGEWVVPPIYEEAKTFCNGIGEVLTDDYRKGYVTVSGKFSFKRPS